MVLKNGEQELMLLRILTFVHIWVNPLTAGAAYIRVFIFLLAPPLNMLKIKCDINQQYLISADIHFVKSE